MKEVIPLEAGHMYVTSKGPEVDSKPFHDDITNYLSRRLYEGGNPIEWEDVCCARGLANCFAGIEHHKTGRDMPMVGVQSAGKVAGRALTAQRTMEHQKRRFPYDSAPGKEEDKKGDKKENPKGKGQATKMIYAAMKRVRAKLPGPMKYAHDSLKTHYRYLVQFSQQLAITFRVDAVLWVGDNQVYNQNFVSALAEDLISEFRDHPKASWMEGVSIFTQIKSVNISLLGVLFCAHQIAKDSRIAADISHFVSSFHQIEGESRKRGGERKRGRDSSPLPLKKEEGKKEEGKGEKREKEEGSPLMKRARRTTPNSLDV